MKYIIFDSPMTQFTPVLFPMFISHDDMARMIPNWRPTSAGMASVDDQGKFHVHGESRGLGLKSEPEDSAILNSAFKRA